MIQFKISKLFGLQTQVDGMALVNQAGIKLAIHEPEKDQALFDANVESIAIPWKSLEQCEFDYGLLGHRLVMVVASPEALIRIPGVVDGRLELEIRRQDRDALKEFERRVAEYRSGQREDNVNEMLDDIRDFLTDL